MFGENIQPSRPTLPLALPYGATTHMGTHSNFSFFTDMLVKKINWVEDATKGGTMEGVGEGVNGP